MGMATGRLKKGLDRQKYMYPMLVQELSRKVLMQGNVTTHGMN
jgi:hypothetical protein